MREYIKGTLETKDIKRLYADMKFQMNCPNQCGKVLIHDFNEKYLSYAEIGDKEIINLYCDDCDLNDRTCEWTVKSKIMKLEVVVAYDPMEITS